MKFSIIIAAYNAEKEIARTLESTLNHTYNDYEVMFAILNMTLLYYFEINENFLIIILITHNYFDNYNELKFSVYNNLVFSLNLL